MTTYGILVTAGGSAVAVTTAPSGITSVTTMMGAAPQSANNFVAELSIMGGTLSTNNLKNGGLASGIGMSYDEPPLAQGQPITVTVHTGPDYPSALALPLVAY